MLNYSSFSLRTIEISDKKRILEWRNSDRVRLNMYTDHTISVDEHEKWFAHALTGHTDIYLIFQYESRAVGFVSFTQLSKEHGRCYWAFYLGETDVPRGCGSAMEFLALDYAFIRLGIRKLCCEVFAFNSAVLKLHEKFGFVQEGRLVEHYRKHGKYEDVICLAKFGAQWTEEREMYLARLFG